MADIIFSAVLCNSRCKAIIEMPAAEGSDYSGTRTMLDYASDARSSGPAIIVRTSDIHSFFCFAFRDIRAVQFDFSIPRDSVARECEFVTYGPRRCVLFLAAILCDVTFAYSYGRRMENTGKRRHGIITILVKLQILWGSPSLHPARSREISMRKMDEIKEFIISRLLSSWIKNYDSLLRRFLGCNLTEREREGDKRPVSISPFSCRSENSRPCAKTDTAWQYHGKELAAPTGKRHKRFTFLSHLRADTFGFSQDAFGTAVWPCKV